MQIHSLVKIDSSVKKTYTNVKTDGETEIIIPKKKKRDELTVLKCLARTVQRDPTGSDYIFMDDPELTPSSMRSKKIWAAAKASGRRAARKIVDELYPNAFGTDMFFEEPSVPLVKDFLPQKVKYEFNEPCEAGLQERIQMRKVQDAALMYKDIKEQGLELSLDTQLSLLHLYTYTNSKDDDEPKLQPEEFKYYKVWAIDKKPLKWKKKGLAEQLFADLPDKTAEAYCSMVRGMIKYGDGKTANNLYKEMLQNNLHIDLATFNDLILSTQTNAEDNEQRWSDVMDILMKMKERNIHPNLKTFQNIFNVMAVSRIKAPKFVFQVLNEMKALNIEPSLGVWHYVLSLFLSNEKMIECLLPQILDYLQNKDLEFQTVQDLNFFATAMKACEKFHNLPLGYRVDALLRSKDNYKFLVDPQEEFSYCDRFLKLVFKFEPMEKVMEVYSMLIPYTVSPNTDVYKSMVDMIELQDAYQYLPVVYQDMTLLNQLGSPNILVHMLSLMWGKDHEPELQKTFSGIVDNLEEKWSSEAEKMNIRNKLVVTGPMIGYFICIKIEAGRFDEAWRIFESYRVHKYRQVEPMLPECMKVLIDECIKTERVDNAIQCLKTMSTEGFTELHDEYKKKISEQMELTDIERGHLQSVS